MNARDFLCVELEVAPGDIVRWLCTLAADLPKPSRLRYRAVGPRDYRGLQGAPASYETLALYAVTPGEPPQAGGFVSGDVALAVTLLPLHRRRLALELRRWSPLPATLDVIAQHLTTYFAQVCTMTSGAATPQAWPGAPPLACNRWLERQLAGAPQSQNANRLYPLWLEQYRALRGGYPADAKRSFRAALQGCRRRLAQRSSPIAPASQRPA